MSNRVQKWNVGPERRKERETFCGRFGKRTPFLRLRAQLHRIRGRTLRTESLDRSNARDLAQVVRLLREVDVSPVSPSSTSQDVSIIYQLLFINKKNTIYLIRYIVFSIFYGTLRKISVMDKKHCIFAQILILKTSNYPAQNIT